MENQAVGGAREPVSAVTQNMGELRRTVSVAPTDAWHAPSELNVLN